MSLTEQSRAELVARALQRTVSDRSGFLARLPVGIYSCDADGLIVQYNERAVSLWGHAPPTGDPRYRYCGAPRSFWADGAVMPSDQLPMAVALRTGEPVRDCEMIVEQAGGARLTILANADPLFDETGRLVGGVNCVQDITALKNDADRARDGARAFRELIDALPAAIYTTDAHGKITFYNRAATELWGTKPKLGEDMWCGTYKLYTADGVFLPHDQCPMAQALKEGMPIRGIEAIVERPDGSRTPSMPYPTPFHDRSGALLGAVNMMVDISERKTSEARQKIMIDELNHRVKNSLATVQAIAAQTFAGGDARRGDVDKFLSRLFALSKTHDHLTREQWTSADLAAILTDVLAPLRDRAADRVRIASAPVRVSPRAALSLGLAINELATNAMKYGSMSVDGGFVDLTCTVANELLSIAWRESGGPVVGAVSTRGFGARMIERSMSAELDGRADLRFAPAGVECDLIIPMAALT